MILDERPTETLARLRAQFPDLDGFAATEEDRAALAARWYASLDAGRPDFGIYDDPVYLSEAFLCWREYSRKYLRALRGLDVDEVSTVLDVGCGIGLSTLALAEVYPTAEIVATQLPGAQERVASFLNPEALILPEPRGHSELVFASEYFEHFPEPIDHLDEILDAAAPRVLVVANTFTSPSAGHFPSYSVAGRGFFDVRETVSGRETARRFNQRLVERGYLRVTTTFWNNRPDVWRKD